MLTKSEALDRLVIVVVNNMGRTVGNPNQRALFVHDFYAYFGGYLEGWGELYADHVFAQKQKLNLNGINYVSYIGNAIGVSPDILDRMSDDYVGMKQLYYYNNFKPEIEKLLSDIKPKKSTKKKGFFEKLIKILDYVRK
jgi:hypothetical protein